MATFSFVDAPLNALAWRVASITGVEALSSLYRFEVAAVCERDALLAVAHDDAFETVAIGRRVSLAFSHDHAGTRYGIVEALTLVGIAPVEDYGADAVEVRFTVAPRAALLGLRTRSRVFQDRYVHEIVSEVLAEHGVRHRWVFKNIYLRRVYCVQYRESDWDFVARLLAEEGIFFFFLHGAFAGGEGAGRATPGLWDRAREYAGYASHASYASSGMGGTVGAVAGVSALVADVISTESDEERDFPWTPPPGGWGAAGDGEVMVLVDHATWYTRDLSPDGLEAPTTVELVLRDHDAHVMALDVVGAVTRFTPRRLLRTPRVELRDVHFSSPLLVHRAAQGADVPERELDQALEYYGHHGEHERADVSVENARNTLDALRADAATWTGDGRHQALTAGMRVQLHNETHALVHDGAYAITRVTHTWNARGPTERDARVAHYRNSFECVDASVSFRAPKTARAPCVVTELATVVGPPGQDVFTDRFGRVRIQFHWDREGKFLAGSSCWVRVAHAWAGAGFGVQFVPRVGMEVVVTFLAGDPDRPVVTGALYNGTHPTPEAFPEHASRSSIRTQTVPGGGGFNELSFEDARGAERVYLHAEKSFDVDVGDGHRATVRGREEHVVMGDRAVAVGGAQRHAVGGARAVMVGRDDSTAVSGDRSTTIGGGSAERVAGNASTHTGGARHDIVDGTAVRTVVLRDVTWALGGRSTHIGDGASTAGDITRVDGNTDTLVGRNVRVEAGLDSTADDAFITLRVRGTNLSVSQGAIDVNAGESVSITADTVSLSTADGSASITLGADGIALRAAKIQLDTGSGGSVTLDAASLDMVAASQMRLKSGDIGFTTGGGGNSESSSNETQTPEPNLRLLLSHGRWRDGVRKLKAGTFCRIVMGTITRDISLERDGELDVYVPDGITLVEVSATPMIDDDPDGYRAEDLPLRWSVALVDEAPPSRSAEEVHWRLSNLGYAVGRVRNGAPDRATREAIRRFQRDQRLAVTGDADDATLSRLEEVSAP